MKYFICGIIGGILATIWNLVILVVGALIGISVVEREPKSKTGKLYTVDYASKEHK